jgi:hypothetical protein
LLLCLLLIPPVGAKKKTLFSLERADDIREARPDQCPAIPWICLIERGELVGGCSHDKKRCRSSTARFRLQQKT